mgnify:CR=1 FL=1
MTGSTSSYSLRNVAWQVWTSVLGWPVQGIWLEASDGTDVNSCCRSGQGDVIATADDYGMIRLYKFPALRGRGKGKGELPPHKAYRGHMSHVMNCRFLCNDTHLISIKAQDNNIAVNKNQIAENKATLDKIKNGAK